MYNAEIELSEATLAKLPKPTGYRVLIALVNTEERTKGGIIVPGQLKDKQDTAAICGKVVDMGADTYADENRFSEPYCSVGDWVMFSSYAGVRFKVDDREFRLINDDSIIAVVEDPSEIKRVGDA